MDELKVEFVLASRLLLLLGSMVSVWSHFLTVVSQMASSSDISQMCTPKTPCVRQWRIRLWATVVSIHAPTIMSVVQSQQQVLDSRFSASIGYAQSSMRHFFRMNEAVYTRWAKKRKATENSMPKAQ